MGIDVDDALKAAQIAKFAMAPTPFGLFNLVTGNIAGKLIGGLFGPDRVDPRDVVAKKIVGMAPEEYMTSPWLMPAALQKAGVLDYTPAGYMMYYGRLKNAYENSPKTAEDALKYGTALQYVLQTGVTPFDNSTFTRNFRPERQPSVMYKPNPERGNRMEQVKPWHTTPYSGFTEIERYLQQQGLDLPWGSLLNQPSKDWTKAQLDEWLSKQRARIGAGTEGLAEAIKNGTVKSRFDRLEQTSGPFKGYPDYNALANQRMLQAMYDSYKYVRGRGIKDVGSGFGELQDRSATGALESLLATPQMTPQLRQQLEARLAERQAQEQARAQTPRPPVTPMTPEQRQAIAVKVQGVKDAMGQMQANAPAIRQGFQDMLSKYNLGDSMNFSASRFMPSRQQPAQQVNQNAGFSAPAQGSMNTQALVDWYNPVTQEQYQAPTGGWTPPDSNWTQRT